MLLAHGFADAADLPLPLSTALLLTGGGVLGVAALVGRRDRSARAGDVPHGRPLPRLTAVIDHTATRTALRGAALTGLALCCAAAALGADRASQNPAPRLAYDVFWPAVLLASALFGPVWPVANPLRLVAAAVSRLAGDPGEQGARPLPPDLGVRPAAVLAALWVWAELTLPDRPSIVLAVVILLALTSLLGSGLYGRGWFAHADPFEASSRLFARLAPLGRDSAGRLCLRSPRAALATQPLPRGAGALMAVLLGGHVFDGLSETLAWQNLQVGLGVALRAGLDTGLLAACVGLAAGLIALACSPDALLLRAFVPVVVGYAFAHYFPVLPIEAQVVLAQASDPLGTGADVLGTADLAVSVTFLPGPVAAVILLLVLVATHVGGVVVGHRIALAGHGPRKAAAVQVGLRAVLVVSALASVALRFVG